MFSFDRFARVATAAVGALVLSSLSIAAAIGPVHADRTAPTTVAQAQYGTVANV